MLRIPIDAESKKIGFLIFLLLVDKIPANTLTEVFEESQMLMDWLLDQTHTNNVSKVFFFNFLLLLFYFLLFIFILF